MTKRTKKRPKRRTLSKKARSRIAKRARAGKEVGEGNFAKIAERAAKKYGSAAAGRRVAASIMWKMAKKRGVTKRGTIKRKKK